MKSFNVDERRERSTHGTVFSDTDDNGFVVACHNGYYIERCMEWNPRPAAGGMGVSVTVADFCERTVAGDQELVNQFLEPFHRTPLVGA
jgi:hypothetical protein